MQILNPDKSNKLLGLYHRCNKFILPLAVFSYVSHKCDYKPDNNVILLPSIVATSYHSYVSTSCIISDYIKNTKVEFPIRLLNVKSHIVATIGFMYYISKYNKK